MKYLLFSFIAGHLSCLSAQNLDYKTSNPQIKRFVSQVLCGKKSTPTSRWTVLPKLDLTSSNPTLKAFVEQAFADITAAAGLTQLPPAGESPTLYVVIGTEKEVKAHPVRRTLGVSLSGPCAYRYWWNDKKELTNAIIHLTPFKTQGDTDPLLTYKDRLLKYMLKTFGLFYEGGGFTDTCLSEDNLALKETLTAMDRKIISYTYKHVPPGTTDSNLWRLMTVHWEDTP